MVQTLYPYIGKYLNSPGVPERADFVDSDCSACQWCDAPLAPHLARGSNGEDTKDGHQARVTRGWVSPTISVCASPCAYVKTQRVEKNQLRHVPRLL